MKNMKKFGALFLTLAMAVSMFTGTGLSAKAEGQTGSINITKYAIDNADKYNDLTERADGNQIDDDSDLLQGLTTIDGVSFRLTKVVYEEDMTVNNAKTDSSFTPVTGTTENGGKLSFGNLEEGVYLLEETGATTEVKDTMDPVLIQIPMDNAAYTEGSNLPEVLWDVYVYPKNLTDSDVPKIEKSVIEEGNMDAGVDRNESFSWIINAEIPDGIEKAQEYRITDELDTRLDFDTDTVPTVQITTEEGVVTLIADTDYIFTSGSDNRSLTFDFTAAGMEKLATAKEDAKKVTVTFNSKVNDTAELGEAIPNQTELHYTNEAGTSTITRSERPEVHTGGYTLYKVDATTGKVLEGAEFKIYATEEDAKAQTNALQTVTSGKDGYATFDGLAYGELGETATEGESTYWIVETKAPVVNGIAYNLLKEPLEVTINATSHLTAYAQTVKNDKDTFSLPFTGGVGTIVFTLGGIALLGAAYVLIRGGRRRENA